MTMFADRHPQGRDTGEGILESVEDLTVMELLERQLVELRAIRLGIGRLLCQFADDADLLDLALSVDEGV